MIQIQAISVFDELKKVEKNWNDLVERCDTNAPTLTYEWISSWWQAYGKKNELFVLLAKDNGDLVGIAPLTKTFIVYRGLRLKVISFIGMDHLNLNSFILVERKKEVVNAMIKYIQENNCGICVFNRIDKDSEEDKILYEILHCKKMNAIRFLSFESPYIKIDTDWDNYIRAKSKNFRHKLHSIDNSFRRLKDYDIIKYTDSEIDKAMQKVIEISRETWKYKEGTAIANKLSDIEFYSSLARLTSKRGWLNLWILNIKSEPAAFSFALLYRNKLFALKIGYNEKYSKFSPSEYLNTHIIKECFDKKLTNFDWCGIIMPYKTRWTNLSQERSMYFIFDNTLSGRILYFIEIVARIKRDFLKKVHNSLVVSVN